MYMGCSGPCWHLSRGSPQWASSVLFWGLYPPPSSLTLCPRQASCKATAGNVLEPGQTPTNRREHPYFQLNERARHGWDSKHFTGLDTGPLVSPTKRPGALGCGDHENLSENSRLDRRLRKKRRGQTPAACPCSDRPCGAGGLNWHSAAPSHPDFSPHQDKSTGLRGELGTHDIAFVGTPGFHCLCL